MRAKIFLAVASLALSAAAAHAVTITDNFDSDSYTGGYGQNYAGDSVFSTYSPAGNGPNAASVDLVGAGTSFPFASAGGTGLFLDMDGSTGYGNNPVAGQIVSNTVLSAGKYTVSFDLAGNQRGVTAQTTEVGVLGSGGVVTVADSITPVNTAAFTTYTTTFTTTGGQLTFLDLGPSDQQGNLLDNIKLTSAAPEPASWALMIAGVGMAGVSLRASRRKASFA